LRAKAASGRASASASAANSRRRSLEMRIRIRVSKGRVMVRLSTAIHGCHNAPTRNGEKWPREKDNRSRVCAGGLLPLPPYPTGFFRGCPRARASTRCRTRAALLKLASTQRTHARVKGRRICKSVTMAAQAIDLAGVEGARDTGVTQAWTQHAGSRSHSTVKRCAAERVQKLRDCLRIDLLDCRRSSATSDFRRQHTCRHDELIFPCSTYPVA
jgi:hypothetical protein